MGFICIFVAYINYAFKSFIKIDGKSSKNNPQKGQNPRFYKLLKKIIWGKIWMKSQNVWPFVNFRHNSGKVVNRMVNELITHHSMEWQTELQQWIAEAYDGQNGDNQSGPASTNFIFKRLQKRDLRHQTRRTAKARSVNGKLHSREF